MEQLSFLPMIAFFDSGQGGLTVWEPVVKYFPNINTCYLGDNARTPYGNKSREIITRYTSEAIVFLNAIGAKLIVVACGTASTAAVPALREIYKVPIIGIVEGFCAEAAQLVQDPSDVVAVLGTRYTVQSGRFLQELNHLSVQNVWQQACPFFVPLVEEGIVAGALCESTLHMYLDPMPIQTRVVMLACTHFPRLAHSIAKYLFKRWGRRIVFKKATGDLELYPGEEHSTLYLLESASSIIGSIDTFINNQRDHNFFSNRSEVYCTDAPDRFSAVGNLFSDIQIPAATKVQLHS